jgi:hypothetical protein
LLDGVERRVPRQITAELGVGFGHGRRLLPSPGASSGGGCNGEVAARTTRKGGTLSVRSVAEGDREEAALGPGAADVRGGAPRGGPGDVSGGAQRGVPDGASGDVPGGWSGHVPGGGPEARGVVPACGTADTPADTSAGASAEADVTGGAVVDGPLLPGASALERLFTSGREHLDEARRARVRRHSPP